MSENPVTKPGDLWLLGNHRLLCGDATVLGNVERVLDGGLADLCFTDPPYNVDYGNSAKDRMRGKKRRIRNDNLGADFERFLGEACTNILTVTKGAAYICMSSSELATLQRAFREAGGHWSTFVIWARGRCRRFGLLATVGRLCGRIGQMGALCGLDVDGERALGRDGEVGLADGRTVPARRLGDQATAQQRAGDLGDRAALKRLGQRMDRAVVAL